MILKAFTIYDSKAKAYKAPFFELNSGTAIRAVMEVVNTPGHGLGKYATDYTLFEIGEFDDSKGILSEYSTHINHGLLDQWKEKKTSSLAETIGLQQSENNEELR